MKKLARTSRVLLASALCVAFSAAAQTPSASGSQSSFSLLPGTSGGYIGFGVGETRFGGSHDFAYRLNAGARVNRLLAVELGYLDFGEVNRFGGTAEAYGVNLSLVGTVPLSDALELHGRVGTTYARTRQSPGLPGTPAGRESDFGLSYGLGVGFNLTPRVQLVGEWDRHRVDFVGGREDISLYTVGMRYRF